MKMTNLALMAATLVLAPAARSDSYTFTPGTEIPLGADVESTATIAGYVTTTGTATLDSRGKDGSTYYVLGTRNAGTTIALSLNNQTAGDYVLSFKTGMASGDAVGTVTVADGSSYSKMLENFSLADTNWDLNDEHLLLLPDLPSGDFTITVNCVSSTNGNGYFGNYGHFKISAVSDAAFVLPSDDYITVDAAYASLTSCSRDSSNNGRTIGSTGDNTRFSFTFYCPRHAKYALTYKTGSDGYTANLNWTVANAVTRSQAWPASGVATEGVANNSTWTLTDTHTLDFGELDAGLYTVTAYVSDRANDGGSNSYAGNYGDFQFSLTEVGDYDLTVSSLVEWSDYYAAAQNVYVEEGGAIVIDATSLATGGTVTLPSNVTLPDGVSASDYYVIKTGAATTETFNNDGTVTIASAQSVDSTTWASVIAGDWNVAANWSHGVVPSATVAADFKANATATLSADATVKTLNLNGRTVTLSGSNALSVDEFDSTETGAIVFSGITLQSNGVSGDTKDLAIPAGVALSIAANSILKDNYGIVYVNGPVDIASGATLRTDFSVSLLGGGTGSGTINSYAGSGNERQLGGDWTGFDGTFSGQDNTTFTSTFVADGSSTWDCKSVKVEGTGSLGILNASIASDKAYALTVASGITEVVLAGGTINSAIDIPAGIAFRKVGTGTLTLDGVSLDSLTVAEGVLAAGANAPTIGTLTMASGSYVAANTTVTINATTATVDGVNVLVEDATVLSAGATYNLITATTLSGTLEAYAVDSEGNHVAASNGKAKNWWLAKARGGVLRLTEGNPNAGMAVFIR